MTGDLDDALEQLRTVSEQLTDARQVVRSLEPEQAARIRAARDLGATDLQLQTATGLSRVTIWKRLKP